MLQLFSREKINGLTAATVVFTTFFLLFLYFLFQIRDIIVLLFLAFILMVAINPISKKIQKNTKLGRLPSVLFAYILFLSVLVLFFSLLLPPLIIEFIALLKFVNLPPLQEQFTKLNFSITDLGSFAGQIGTSVTAVMAVIGSTFSGIFTLFTLFVISFFMLLEREILHKKLNWLIKDETELKRIEMLLNELELQLGGWVRGELILMTVIGVMTYVGLTILGVPYAVPLALLAGFLEILPNIGPTIAAVPAVALAFISGGPLIGVATLVLNVIIQQLENNVIVPKVMKSAVNVNPLVSIIAILIGLKTAGVIGALLAVPTYIVLRTIYGVYLYRHRL
ncbi:AI-2E family transporter [Candidatus Woesebacteria bacterium]|nr:AI-2E family transporter [Candidatus Woesebacteria bacterium]